MKYLSRVFVPERETNPKNVQGVHIEGKQNSANMVYDYSKLEGRIVDKFRTRENFAKSLGVTTKSISEKLNSKTIWKQPEISKAMELLSISGEDIELYFFKKKSNDMEQE